MWKVLILAVALMLAPAAAGGAGSGELYTPVAGFSPAYESGYLCAQEAVEATRGRHWAVEYADVPRLIGEVSEEMAYSGRYPMSVCELADALVVLSWWETSWRPRRGGIGEQGLTQVTPCERFDGGRRCQPGFDPELRWRPTRAWLQEDPRNPLRWSAAYLQQRGVTWGSMRRYNGSGPLARAYARRFFASLDRIEEWRERPHDPEWAVGLPRDVRAEGSPWAVPRHGEPRGAW